MIITLALIAQAATPLTGHWTNERKSVVVLIAPCANTAALCGTVQSASEEAQRDARRGGTDSLIGAELLHGFVPIGDDRWRGTLFIPDMNRRSKADIIRLDDDNLRVRGCAIGKLLCKSQNWSRIRD